MNKEAIMAGVTILTESELRKIIQVDREAIDAIAHAFTWLTEGKAAMPPIMHIPCGNKGDVDIKAAYVEGLERFAVKLGAGFFGNRLLGLPSSPAMMVVLSSTTGVCQAVLLDNAYLTDVRTAAAGAVAALHLAPEQVETAGVIGAGAQGRYQMMALKVVRNFKRLLVYDLDAEGVKKYIEEMTRVLKVEVVAASGPEEVIRESQSVVTSTPSRKGYVEKEWLHEGLHITAMGADLPEKQELFTDAPTGFDVLSCDRKTQSFKMGELHHAFDAGLINGEMVIELGELTSGKKMGRTNEKEITLCDLSGTGVQDTAIAVMALEKAARLGLGSVIETR